MTLQLRRVGSLKGSAQSWELGCRFVGRLISVSPVGVGVSRVTSPRPPRVTRLVTCRGAFTNWTARAAAVSRSRPPHQPSPEQAARAPEVSAKRRTGEQAGQLTADRTPAGNRSGLGLGRGVCAGKTYIRAVSVAVTDQYSITSLGRRPLVAGIFGTDLRQIPNKRTSTILHRSPDGP